MTIQQFCYVPNLIEFGIKDTCLATMSSHGRWFYSDRQPNNARVHPLMLLVNFPWPWVIVQDTRRQMERQFHYDEAVCYSTNFSKIARLLLNSTVYHLDCTINSISTSKLQYINFGWCSCWIFIDSMFDHSIAHSTDSSTMHTADRIQCCYLRFKFANPNSPLFLWRTYLSASPVAVIVSRGFFFSALGPIISTQTVHARLFGFSHSSYWTRRAPHVCVCIWWFVMREVNWECESFKWDNQRKIKWLIFFSRECMRAGNARKTLNSFSVVLFCCCCCSSQSRRQLWVCVCYFRSSVVSLGWSTHKKCCTSWACVFCQIVLCWAFMTKSSIHISLRSYSLGFAYAYTQTLTHRLLKFLKNWHAHRHR